MKQRINNSFKKICNREISFFFTAAFNISKPRIRRKRFPPDHLLTYLLDPNPIELSKGRELDSGCKKILSMPRGFFWWDLLKRYEKEKTSKRRGKKSCWKKSKKCNYIERHSRREIIWKSFGINFQISCMKIRKCKLSFLNSRLINDFKSKFLYL